MSLCLDDDCKLATVAKGLCSHHYYVANKARFKENSDRWRIENGDRFREIKRKSEARHPETKRANHARNNKPMTEVKRVQMNVASRKAQTQTRVAADRHNHIYTSWELETIADESRSVHEVALLIGRTYKAISRMRSMVREDPKTITRAGIASDGSI